MPMGLRGWDRSQWISTFPFKKIFVHLLLLYSQLHLSVYTEEKTCSNINWVQHSKFGVGGCCRFDLFSLNKYTFHEFLDVKNNSGGKFQGCF